MIDNVDYTMNNHMQFFIKLQLELDNDTWAIIMHVRIDKIEGKKNTQIMWIQFVTCQGKWLVPLEVIFWITLDLPCYIVSTQYQLNA